VKTKGRRKDFSKEATVGSINLTAGGEMVSITALEKRRGREKAPEGISYRLVKRGWWGVKRSKVWGKKKVWFNAGREK